MSIFKKKKKHKKKEPKKKKGIIAALTSPFDNTAKRAEKTLSDAEIFIKDGHTAVKVGAIVFTTSMCLSMISSAISIKLGMRALKENKMKEEVMMWNLMKKYADKA